MLLAGFAAGAVLSCSRSEPPAPAPTRHPADAAAIAERKNLFGAEALASGIEWRSNGLGYHILDPGTGSKPGIGAAVTLTYTGRLKDGTVFDHEDKPMEFRIGSTIPGLSAGLQMLGSGGKAVFYIPPTLGYGARKVAGIPPNSGLIFDVNVLEITP